MCVCVCVGLHILYIKWDSHKDVADDTVGVGIGDDDCIFGDKFKD